MSKIEFRNINKSFGENKVINNFSIKIDSGEFVVLVGPSGCGKSTLLRMVSGLEAIDQGQILLNDKILNDLIPSKREIAMVFQSYALYPHMNVYENMSFGLKMENKNKNYIDEKVKEAAKMLQIEDLLERKPKELSGGQKQRVAIGRAITRNPKIFLFDEPLSNLDAALRSEMRVEISKLHKKINTNMIYVTHDQVEAMTLADRIVVMKDGEIQQVDHPLKSYHNPSNTFVASFLGTPPMNMVEGKVSKGNFTASNSTEFKGTFKKKLPNKYKSFEGDCVLGFRPENTAIILDSKRGKFKMVGIESLGSESVIHIDYGNIKISAIMHKPDVKFDQNFVDSNSKIDIGIDEDSLRLFDFEGNTIKI